MTEPRPSEFDDVLGAEIASAITDLRVDPNDFTDDVLEAIEDRAEFAPPRTLPGFVRRAATILPPVLLPLGLAQKTVAATAAASKASSVKFLPGVVGILAMPAAIAVMLVMTFVVGVQRIRFGDEQRDDVKATQRATLAWWKRNGLTVLVAGAGLYALLLFDYTTAIVVFCVGSMVFLVAIVGSLARAGHATRREVGSRTAGLLAMTAPTLFALGGVTRLDHDLAEHSGHLAGAALILAGVVCGYLSVRSRTSPSGRRVATSLLVATTALMLTLTLGVVSLAPGRTHHDLESARHWIESYVEPELVAAALSGWDVVAKTTRQLTAVGQAPDLATVTEQLHRHLDALADTGEEPNPLFYLECAFLGLLRDVDFERMRKPYFDERTLRDTRPRINVRHDGIQILRWLHNGGLSDADKEQLADRIVRGRGVDPFRLTLEDLLTRTLLLRHLGHEELLPELTPDVHVALEATWTGTPGSAIASFVNSDTLFTGTDDDGVPWGKERWQDQWSESSSDAVELMAHHGVPEGLDLRRFRRAQEPHLWQYGHGAGRGALTAATIANLDRIAGTRPSTGELAVRWLLSYRVLWVALVLGLFCIVITLRAPQQVASGTSPH